jgi:hypothetical protein
LLCLLWPTNRLQNLAKASPFLSLSRSVIIHCRLCSVIGSQLCHHVCPCRDSAANMTVTCGRARSRAWHTRSAPTVSRECNCCPLHSLVHHRTRPPRRRTNAVLHPHDRLIAQGHASLRGYLALHSRRGSGITLSWIPVRCVLRCILCGMRVRVLVLGTSSCGTPPAVRPSSLSYAVTMAQRAFVSHRGSHDSASSIILTSWLTRLGGGAVCGSCLAEH